MKRVLIVAGLATAVLSAGSACTASTTPDATGTAAPDTTSSVAASASASTAVIANPDTRRAACQLILTAKKNIYVTSYLAAMTLQNPQTSPQDAASAGKDLATAFASLGTAATQAAGSNLDADMHAAVTQYATKIAAVRIGIETAGVDLQKINSAMNEAGVAEEKLNILCTAVDVDVTDMS